MLYDLLLPAVYARNFDYGGLANRSIGLGYNRQLLKHFYPDRCAPELSARAQQVVEGVNANAIELLEQTHEFAGAADLDDRLAIERFGAQLQRDSAGAQELLGQRIEAVLREIDQAAGVGPQRHLGMPTAFGPITQRRFARRGLVAAVAAGVMWVLSGCGCQKSDGPPPHVSEMAPAPVDEDRADVVPPSAPEMAPAPMDRDRPDGGGAPDSDE